MRRALRSTPAWALAVLLTGCGGAAATQPPSDRTQPLPSTTAQTPHGGASATPSEPATAGRAGSGTRVVLTAPVYDAPGARVPIIVTVHEPPSDLPAAAIAAQASDGQVTDCGPLWRNAGQDSASRQCYLLAPRDEVKLDLIGTAAWSAEGRPVSLRSPPVSFRTSGPVSGPVSLGDAQRIESCGNPGREVWLTFDDFVPSTTVANSLVETLARNHARGRFFLNHVSAAIRKILEDAGHIITDHTRDHLPLNKMTDAQIRDQIAGGPRTTPGAPDLLRPPYGAGAEAARVVDVIASVGYATCRWTVDTRDWAGATPAEMADAVRYGNAFTPPVEAGGVILMHANHFAPEKLQAVIDAVRARGLEPEALPTGR